MSSLFGLLRTGYRGLAAQRLLTEVAGQNIANATTPGYRRQEGVLVTMSSVPGANTGGVRVLGLRQSRDAFLQRELVAAGGTLGREQALRETLESLEPYLSGVEGDGLDAALNRLLSGFDRLTGDPSNLALRSEILGAGAELAARVRRTALALRDGQTAVDRTLQGAVAEANGSLARVAALNREIAVRQGAGDPALDLRDERDRLVRELSTEIGLQVLEADDGSVTLLAGGGRAIVQGEAAGRLALEIPAGESRPRLSAVIGNGGGVSLDPAGGRLGGLISARDEVVGPALEALDRFAFDFATAVNDVHRAGFGLDGVDGRSFFTPMMGIEGAAEGLELAAALAGAPERVGASGDLAGIPGDNVVALALAALSEQANFGSGTETPSVALGRVANEVAGRLAGARSEEDAQRTMVSRIEELYASRTGVSIEEEMIQVTASQRALEASARALRAADEMLQTVLRMV